MSLSFVKKLAGFTGVLLVLWGIYLYRQIPHARTPFAKDAGLAPRISIQVGSQKIELSKKGADWQVAQVGGAPHPADGSKISTLVSDLKSLQVEDEISERPDRMAEYQVDDASGTRLILADAAGKALAEGIFGKQAPDYVHSYFRYPDTPNVYLARGVSPGDLGSGDANFWRSRQLVDIGESNIQQVTIEGKGYKTDLVRASTDSWTMNGKAIAPGAADVLLGALAHLSADDFIDPHASSAFAYDLLKYAKVTVKESGQSVELHLGPPDTKLKRYPASTGPDAGSVWISEASANAILRKPSAFKTK